MSGVTIKTHYTEREAATMGMSGLHPEEVSAYEKATYEEIEK